MTTDLAIQQATTEISPLEFEQAMTNAIAKAKTLAKIVESEKLYTLMGQGKKHLHVEAWLTIAKGYGLSAGVESDEILYDPEDNERGAKAHAIVIDELGTIRGRATGYCMRSEATWKNKPIYQLTSMAGTRAVSKALSLQLRWVVVLAGYSPTPADEMERDSTGPIQQKSTRRKKSTAEEVSEHFCSEHGVGRNQDRKERWFHIYGEDYCMEGVGLLDKDGNQVIEPRQVGAMDPSDNMAEFDEVVDSVPDFKEL